MVTPELVSYIKGEFAKGKTREMICATLVSEGGWNEVDLNDAFRTAVPMQGFMTSANSVQPIQNNPIQNTPAQSSSMYNSSPVIQNPISQINPIKITPTQSSSMYNSSPVIQNPISQINPIKITPTQSSPIQSSSFHSSLDSPVIGKSAPSSILKKSLLIITILIFVGTAVWYFYRAQVTEIWNSLSSSYSITPVIDNTVVTPEVTELIVDNTVVPIPLAPVAPAIMAKDCGISASPDLKKFATYKDNTVLSCLGNSALVCEDAKAILTDVLFPNMMEIVKDQNTNTCSFRLSYSNDSTLNDSNGNALAGQYILCPISVVKSIDDSKLLAPVFKAPTLTDVTKYASQIYFYGTIGVFMENNVDINKIQALGCSGNYINSVIMSYKKTQ